MKKIKYKKKYSSIINEIQKTRSKNNTNWMNILRLAFKFAPEESSKIMKKINFHDKKISNLIKKLGKNQMSLKSI